MGLIIGLVVGYLLGMPLLLQFIHMLHKKLFIKRKMEKLGKNAKPSDLPKPLMPKLREGISFTIKDKRPVTYGGNEKKQKEPKQLGITRKMLMIVLWAIGGVVFILGGITGIFMLIPVGMILFFAAVVFGYKSPQMVLQNRRKTIQRMYNIGKKSLGLNAEHGDMNQVVRVLEWDEYIKPKKVEYFLPDTFGMEGEEGFMRQFNQIFGTTTAWVPSDDPETHEPGWNYDKAKATFHAVPPLPMRAPWKELYVTHPGIAWSFFALGLGVENGVEMQDPETGEQINILGFDLSGKEREVGENAGLKVSPNITTSPMCFTPETRIMVDSGIFKSFEELLNLNEEFIKIPTFDEDNNIINGYITKITKTQENVWVWKIILNDGSWVECTSDHLFRLIDGKYIRAIDITPEMKLANYYDKELMVIDKFKSRRSDVYDAHVPNTENFFVKFNDGEENCVAVHNCLIGGGTGGGKSLSVDSPISRIGDVVINHQI